MALTNGLPDTPVMRQYQTLKNKHPNSILFFRLGDFYEMFGSDAQTAAPVLGLVLTSRQGVPMCGIPFHSHRGYVAKLLKAGHKVALAEQMEPASKTKKIVRRAITRLITPGTIIEDELLEPTATNFLVAIELDIVGWGAAIIDVSSGDFWATQALNDQGSKRLLGLLARLSPAEVLATPEAAKTLKLRDLLADRVCLTLNSEAGALVDAPWGTQSVWKNHHLAARAALRCRRYVAETQFHLKELLIPSYREAGSEMQLDETAIKTLELVESPSGEKKHTLWGLLDCCRTSMGSRKLKHWILHPLTEVPAILQRQDCVSELYDKPEYREGLSSVLQEVSDLPRVINRLCTHQAGPRDLGALRDSLAERQSIIHWLTETQLSSGLADAAKALTKVSAQLDKCYEVLKRALADKLPHRLSEGHVIRDGYNAGLDELRLLRSDSQGFLQKLEAAERKSTNIPSLKAGYNSVFGYYFEITKTHSSKVPARYIRKQTLTNAERYITPELKELETKILGAEDKITRLEAKVFEELREVALKHHGPIMSLAAMISDLDVFCALAEAASMHEFVQPIVDLSHDLSIIEGRHPVLSALMPSGDFVPNSLELNAVNPRIIILTGPNMSGKSTFLRQNALIALMAQIGSFVPAKSAKIGVIDKILTRIGAQDAISQGQSTFMVEMSETSHILKSATRRSLLILDEVGRGTSTFDGISIAWAVIEHLHGTMAEEGESAQGPRVLFATHYFELTDLPKRLEGIVNFNVEAKEWTNTEGKTEVVFLHKISPGPADRSYGIHVAALAGLPISCLARAREILGKLETDSAAGRLSKTPASETTPELPLFEDHVVLHALRLLDTDSMTPLEALKALNELKKKV